MSSHEPFRVLAKGPWPRARVRTRRVAHTIVGDASARAIVEDAWAAACARAKAAGQTLFPGPVLGLSGFREIGDALELDLHETDYKEFVGTNLAPAYLALPRATATRADALGLSVLLLSGEEIIFHRRGQGCFEWPLAIDTPGGHMEPARHATPFDAAADELDGELGVSASEVRDWRAIGLTRIEDTEKPQLVLAARVDLTVAEVRARLEKAEDRFETAELLPVELRDLSKLAASRERLTPAVRASLFLARELLP